MAQRGKRTIVEEIRLTGAPEIEAQFAAMGEAGVKAFAELKKAADSAGNSTALSKFINQTAKEFKQLQTQAKAVVTSYKELGAASLEFGRNVTIVAAAVAGAGVGLFEFTKHAADVADETGKAAQAAGLAIDQYGKLQFVFEQGNVDADSFATGMKKLNQNIAQAASGSGAGATLFKNLGISVKDAAGNILPTDTILQRLADKFKSLPDGPQKSALAIQLFGKAGAAIIPILNDGAAAIQALEDQAVSLGLVLDKNAAQIGQDFGDSLNALQRTVGGVQVQLGLLFAPAFTEAFKAITQIIVDNRQAILDFGQVIANQVAPAIKDILAVIEGKDSQVVNKNFIAIRDTVVSIGQAVGILAGIFTEVFNQLTELVRPFVEIFNEIFGTKFTAQAAIISVILFGLTGGFKLVGLSIKALSLTWELFVTFFKTGAGLIQIIGIGIVATIGVIQNAIDDVGTAFSALPGIFVAVGQGIAAAVQAIANFILAVWTGLTTNTGTLFTDLGNTIVGAFTTVFDFIKGKVDEAIGWIKSIIDGAAAAAKAVGDALSGGGGSDGGGGHARGGLIRGPGTPTSDSIPARLSTGEFVVRAKAVSRYGIGLLSALNSMRLPKSMGFAHGGLVGAVAAVMPPIPAFAAGGPVGRPFSLSIGPDTFDGLIAPETVANKLVRYATARQVRSAGRRPSWSK